MIQLIYSNFSVRTVSDQGEWVHCQVVYLPCQKGFSEHERKKIKGNWCTVKGRQLCQNFYLPCQKVFSEQEREQEVTKRSMDWVHGLGRQLSQNCLPPLSEEFGEWEHKLEVTEVIFLAKKAENLSSLSNPL